MDYLIRFIQAHEPFRLPELESLANLASTPIETVSYSPDSPFCIIRLHPSTSSNSTNSTTKHGTEPLARDLISRSILSKGIYELWGLGTTYSNLHSDVQTRSSHLWSQYENSSFRFSVDGYHGKRSSTEQTEIINSFRYLGFKGPIDLVNPDVEFTVFEEWDTPDHLRPDPPPRSPSSASNLSKRNPKALHFARHISPTSRHLIAKHSLKTRPYISTTSMDAELALVTATLALARPGTLFLDPFVGTGGFMVAAAELGAVVMGSDIDGRSFRGKSTDRLMLQGVGANFRRYGLEGLFGDCIISDLTNTPLRSSSTSPTSQPHARYLNGILTDPPYGVREGLKVLGRRPPPPSKTYLEPNITRSGVYMINNSPAHLLPGYIPPKRAYSFTAMLDDILDFAAKTLVDDGRLAFWMPTANEEESEAALTVGEGCEADDAIHTPIPIPTHPHLQLLHCCVQPFNKWSRRLLVYRRKTTDEIEAEETTPAAATTTTSIINNTTHTSIPAANGTAAVTMGTHADDVNPFRRAYFQGFKK